MDATVDLVARRGSHVGMTEIAQAAGVSRKAVYENFGSRDQVLLQTTVNLLRAELSLKSATLSGEGDVLERLAHTVPII
ncbi:TetR/AcrR family transcriptional regulator [Kocuria atrinae]|uniref:TetR/AcrR family transcriptional regulator n=1 Tax=Kocuria atrinae TaxID=592377 RepID=UPI001CB9542A|nr:helix-turn-helix domain-containing protein [Kocuria atrinae]